MLCAVCFWGIRLTGNWAYTFKNLPAQDWRYTMLHDKLYLLAGAVANTLLFLFISVPLAENHQSRKPGFEEYKKETRVFI